MTRRRCAPPPTKTRRMRVFRSPCCGVVSRLERNTCEDIGLSICYQCFLVHESSGLKTWLQDLMLMPLGSEVSP